MNEMRSVRLIHTNCVPINDDVTVNYWWITVKVMLWKDVEIRQNEKMWQTFYEKMWR